MREGGREGEGRTREVRLIFLVMALMKLLDTYLQNRLFKNLVS